MKAKKYLPIIFLLIFVFLIVGSLLLLFLFNPEKQIKINAESFNVSVDKKEVAKLLGNAFAFKGSTKILGVQTPIKVEKKGLIKNTDFSFNAIATSWSAFTPSGAEIIIQVRTSNDGVSWTSWRTIEEDEDGDAKDDITPTETYGRLVVASGAYIQERIIFKTDSLEKIPELKNLKLTYIDSKEKHNLLERVLKRIELRAKEVFAAADVPKRPTDTPSICSRSCWGADESLRTWNPYYAPLKKMVVHHTVTSNNDPNPKATIRAIYYFHAVTRGWGDIGYNFLVDQNNGTIYEGRYGGDTVIGAHARGYNTGSVGVGVLGDFRYVGVNNKVRNALHKITVWKFYNHKIDPDKSTSFGNPKRTLPSVFYHGQVGNTACAGTYLNRFVPSIKKMAHYMPQQIVLRDSSGTRRIEGNNDKTVSDLLNEYKNKGIGAPNYIRKVSAFPTDGTTLPDDPNYSSQWDLAKLDALSVWKETTGGSSTIKVAIIDTGVAYEDYDPAGPEKYTQGPDFAATNFVPGFDYINNDTHPNDDHGHGTVVASVIAESTNNSLGSASLAYNVSIMPIKVCDKDGWCVDDDIADGIDFARNNGVKVINISLGGDDYSEVIQSAIDEAWNSGIVIVVATGNDSTNVVSYPARGNHVVGVGALTSSDTRASYSNYGSGLDLMAPGGDAGGSSGDLLYQKVSCTAALDCTSFSYSRVAGTSLSTALVSASAALVVSKGTVWPASVERFLKLKALDLGSTGPDSTFGWGMVHPFDAFTLSSGDKPHPNGVLITTNKSVKVYLIENDQKRWIPNRNLFARRFRWGNVTTVSSFEENSYPDGTNVVYPDGGLLQESTSKVYVLENGQKRWITSLLVFEDLGYQFSDVIKISDSELNGYTTGANIASSTTHPDGSLVTSNLTNKIYLIDSGQKRWILSRGVFESRYFFKYVLAITDSKLNSYTNGSNVNYPDGSLVKDLSDPSGKVYIVSTATGSSTQTKRHFVSRITFEGLSFKWENVNSDSSPIIGVFSDGSKLY